LGQWTGTLFKFSENGSTKIHKDSVIKTNVVPKNGWTNLIIGLYKNQIKTLQDMNNIEGLDDSWTDGWGCSIEIGAKEKYRFYNYHSPEHFEKEFSQAKNMVNIVNLVQTEFGIKWKQN
jgi:hypothetical protein